MTIQAIIKIVQDKLAWIQDERRRLSKWIPEIEKNADIIFAIIEPYIIYMPKSVQNAIRLIQKWEPIILQYLKAIQIASAPKKLSGEKRLAIAVANIVNKPADEIVPLVQQVTRAIGAKDVVPTTDDKSLQIISVTRTMQQIYEQMKTI